MMDELEQKVKRVKEILNRIDPKVKRTMDAIIDKDGIEVTLSVASNIGSSLLAMGMLIVHARGSDPNQYLESLIIETMNRFSETRNAAEAQQVILKAQGKDPDTFTCQPPLH
jgi:hypothetical protein